MGYLHIDNLYKNQDVLLFKKCYRLEKVHGTSAHINWRVDPNQNAELPLQYQLIFFSGGEKHNNFVALFDQNALTEKLSELALQHVTIYGEAYGGKCQGMSATYGKDLKFIAFDVKIGDSWLTVPQAAAFCESLGLEFVPWNEGSTDLEELNTERDKPSEVAIRRGCGSDKVREGIIIRPLIELTKNNGARLIAKHKTEKFSERATPQKVVDKDKLVVLQEANAIADEWVTEERLSHVLDKLPQDINVEGTGTVIKAMIEDVCREAAGEIVESKEAKAAIGKRAATLFKERMKSKLCSIA